MVCTLYSTFRNHITVQIPRDFARIRSNHVDSLRQSSNWGNRKKNGISGENSLEVSSFYN